MYFLAVFLLTLLHASTTTLLQLLISARHCLLWQQRQELLTQQVPYTLDRVEAWAMGWKVLDTAAACCCLLLFGITASVLGGAVEQQLPGARLLAIGLCMLEHVLKNWRQVAACKGLRLLPILGAALPRRILLLANESHKDKAA